MVVVILASPQWRLNVRSRCSLWHCRDSYNYHYHYNALPEPEHSVPCSSQINDVPTLDEPHACLRQLYSVYSARSGLLQSEALSLIVCLQQPERSTKPVADSWTRTKDRGAPGHVRGLLS